MSGIGAGGLGRGFQERADPIPPAGIQPPQMTRAEARSSLMATILILAFFMPQELSIFFLDQRWTPSRLILAVLAPYLLLRFLLVLLEAPRGIAVSDVLLIVPGVWMIIASSQTGNARWLSYGGSYAMELCVPYAAARSLLRTEAQLLNAIRLFATAVGITGYLAILDPLAGIYITKLAIGSITGVPSFPFIDYRMGIMRAFSVYEHPILLGVASVTGIMICIYMRMPGRWFILAGCMIGLFLSLSSGPVAGMACGLGIVAYDRVTKGIGRRWYMLAVLITVPLAMLFLFHPSPWALLFRLVLFDPQTAWWRVYTFELVWPWALASPWVGYGEPRFAALMAGSSTIDSQWLGLIITFGFPAAAGALAIMFGCCSVSTGPYSPARLSPPAVLMARCLGIMMFLFFVIGFTVAYWGSMYLASSFLAGMRASVGAVSRQR